MRNIPDKFDWLQTVFTLISALTAAIYITFELSVFAVISCASAAAAMLIRLAEDYQTAKYEARRKDIICASMRFSSTAGQIAETKKFYDDGGYHYIFNDDQ